VVITSSEATTMDKSLIRVAVVGLLLAATAGRAAAQQVLPPEPLPMATAYAYQPGNMYWYQPVGINPSPYPFGATRPIYGRYSWDYSVYFASGIGYYTPNIPHYPYSYAYPSLPPTLPSRVWYGYGW
jgi:hypothetical protein